MGVRCWNIRSDLWDVSELESLVAARGFKLSLKVSLSAGPIPRLPPEVPCRAGPTTRDKDRGR